MTVMEKIFEVSKKLPNTLQKEVLDFAEYLMYRRTEGDSRSLNFGLKIHKRFQGLKFDELVIPPRSIIRNPPDLHYE